MLFKNISGESDRYTILLSHRPELFDVYVENNIDLVLSGHTHGGQFRLPVFGGIVAPNQGFFPKYLDGVYEKKQTKMVVSYKIMLLTGAKNESTLKFYEKCGFNSRDKTAFIKWI